VILVSEDFPDRGKFKVQSYKLQTQRRAKEGSNELNSIYTPLYSNFFKDCCIFFSKVIEMIQFRKPCCNFFKHNISWQKVMAVAYTLTGS